MALCQVVLWWPPKLEQAQQAEAPQQGNNKMAPKETFSPETAKLLASLGSQQPADPTADSPASSSAQVSWPVPSEQPACPSYVLTPSYACAAAGMVM